VSRQQALFEVVAGELQVTDFGGATWVNDEYLASFNTRWVVGLAVMAGWGGVEKRGMVRQDSWGRADWRLVVGLMIDGALLKTEWVEVQVAAFLPGQTGQAGCTQACHSLLVSTLRLEPSCQPCPPHACQPTCFQVPAATWPAPEPWLACTTTRARPCAAASVSAASAPPR